jgi:hypothetical protein
MHVSTLIRDLYESCQANFSFIHIETINLFYEAQKKNLINFPRNDILFTVI